MAVTADPPAALVKVRDQGPFVVIENYGHKPVNRIVLRAEFPISVFWIALSIAALLGTITALLLSHPGASNAPSSSSAA